MSKVHLFLSRFLGRRALIGLAVLVLLGLCHAPILRLLAWPLMTSDSSAACDYFCIHGGELGTEGFETFDRAAAWYAEAPGRKILLLLPRTSRIVEVGAVPSFEQTCRGQLSKRRVPPADVWPICGEARNVWEEARAMDDWLKGHPGSMVRLACSTVSSGRLRYALRKVLGPGDAQRVRLAISSDPGRPIESWWRSRNGVKDFMYGWLELIYAWTVGDDTRPLSPGAADFQREIRARIGEAPL